MMWWYGNGSGMDGWAYGLMTVSMVLFWGLVIYGVVTMVRYLGREDRSVSARLTPEQVLAERFAHGQIDEHEYRQRLDVLRGEHGPLVQP